MPLASFPAQKWISHGGGLTVPGCVCVFACVRRLLNVSHTTERDRPRVESRQNPFAGLNTGDRA